METEYNELLSISNKKYYKKLSELINSERLLYKEALPERDFGFIDYSKAKEIVLKAPDKSKLLDELSKYEYDTAVTVNNALYTIFSILRSQSTDTVFVQQVTEEMLDFAVKITPYFRNISKYEISENSWYYNQKSINKLLRIVKKEYTKAEKITASIYWARQFKYNGIIQSELGKIYINDLKSEVSNKKKREKKSRDLSYEKLKSLYPQREKELHDSLFSISAKEGVERLYEKDVSHILYTLGKIYAFNSVEDIHNVLEKTEQYGEGEIYMAKIALARLGVDRFIKVFLEQETPKAGELIYLCSQESAYKFSEIISDTSKHADCFAWAWEIFGEDFKDLKVLQSLKYLWILNKVSFIEDFSAGFDYKYDDYCLFYSSVSYSREYELELIANAIKWLNDNKGNYILNPNAYDYDLRY